MQKPNKPLEEDKVSKTNSQDLQNVNFEAHIFACIHGMHEKILWI